jgi:hypothetical protein
MKRPGDEAIQENLDRIIAIPVTRYRESYFLAGSPFPLPQNGGANTATDLYTY